MKNFLRGRRFGDYISFAILLAWMLLAAHPITLTENRNLVYAASDPVIAAAGDIACDPTSTSFNNGNGSPSACRQKYTSDLLVNQDLAAVLALGDIQYYCGGYQAFLQSYDLSWGRVKSITRPVVGNHEYLTSGGTDCTIANANAAGYFQYFGSAAGNLSQGYYSYEIGTWHIIALNSNCGDIGGCSSVSPQGKWLLQDLADHPNYCTLAYWHIPLFSSGGRAEVNSQALWQTLYDNDVDVILNGHDHIYERFAPQAPDGSLDTLRGMREFIVGSGGANHTALAAIAANSEVRNVDTYGILKLTLHPTSYDWKFVPEAGKSFTDEGTGTCHGNGPVPTPPVDTPVPTATLPPTSADVQVWTADQLKDSPSVEIGQMLPKSYAGVNEGPVKILSTNGVPIIGSERVLYKVNGTLTSFSEMMALPASQLDTTYWLPWYNNVDLDSQLRFGNVSSSKATVHVYIHGVEAAGSPFTLAPGESRRQSFAGINNGPVKITSTVNIIAAQRVIYKVNGIPTSFSEMMALPNDQIDKTYWLPWYNNVDLDTQLRFGNITSSRASVHVIIGGVEMSGSPFSLAAGQSARLSFSGINNGPVKLVSNVDIVASERVIFKVNGTPTSFSETMALSNEQLSKIYWLPWYNNVNLDTQLRFANTSTSNASVHVYVGGKEITGSPFPVAAGKSTRQNISGLIGGPVKVVSNTKIVVTERFIYKINNVSTSFSEMLALPDNQRGDLSWLPWYNDVDLDTQLRLAAP